MNKVPRYSTGYKIEEVQTIDKDIVEPTDNATCKNCTEAERIMRNEARKQAAPAPAAKPEAKNEKE